MHTGGGQEFAKSAPYVLQSPSCNQDQDVDELRKTARARAVAAWIAQRDACADGGPGLGRGRPQDQAKRQPALPARTVTQQGQENGLERSSTPSSKPSSATNSMRRAPEVENSSRNAGKVAFKASVNQTANGSDTSYQSSSTLTSNTTTSGYESSHGADRAGLALSGLSEADTFWGTPTQTPNLTPNQSMKRTRDIAAESLNSHEGANEATPASALTDPRVEASIKSDRPSPILPSPIRPVPIKLSSPGDAQSVSPAGARRCVVVQDFSADRQRIPNTVDVLRGEVVSVLNRANGWAYVETADGYLGYIPDHFCQPIHSPGFGDGGPADSLHRKDRLFGPLSLRLGQARLSGHSLLERSRSATPSMRRSAFSEVQLHERLKRCSSSSPTFGVGRPLHPRLTRVGQRNFYNAEASLQGLGLRARTRTVQPKEENPPAIVSHYPLSLAAGYESGSSSGIESDESPTERADYPLNFAVAGSQSSSLNKMDVVGRKKTSKLLITQRKGVDEPSFISAESEAMPFSLSPGECPNGSTDTNRFSQASSGISVSTVFNKQTSRRVVMLFNFKARAENDLSAVRGDCLSVLNDEDAEWLWVANRFDAQGFVPRSYVQELHTSLLRTGRRSKCYRLNFFVFCFFFLGGGGGGERGSEHSVIIQSRIQCIFVDADWLS